MARRVGPPLPPENFNLNAFLVEIADETTEDDVDKMKSLLTGPGGIGRGILEDIIKPIDFFQKLQTTGYLTVNDISVLQALLWTVGKVDIYKKTVEFAEQSVGVLHVCTPNPEPVNGFQYVRFHLKGKIDKNAVEDLRERISRWFRVPRHFVVISGVQPTGSWHITLMIPEICAENLRNFSGVKKKWLILQNIDTVELDGEVIDLTDSDGGKPDVAKEDDVACKELQRLTKVNSDLENRIDILSSQLVKEQDAPIRFGSENGVKRIAKEFDIHVEELLELETDLSWPFELQQTHLVGILDLIVQQLQKNLYHIEHIREKRQTDFNTEYDKSKPDQTGQDDLFWRFLELLRYHEDLERPIHRRKSLSKICKEIQMSCYRLAFYLTNIEEDVRGLMAAQYDSTSWVDRNLNVIAQEVRTVEDFAKKYMEATKKITERLTVEEDDYADCWSNFPSNPTRTRALPPRPPPGIKESSAGFESVMPAHSLSPKLAIDSGYGEESVCWSKSPRNPTRTRALPPPPPPRLKESSAGFGLRKPTSLQTTDSGYIEDTEPISEPEIPHPSTSWAATEETKASSLSDETGHKQLGS